MRAVQADGGFGFGGGEEDDPAGDSGGGEDVGYAFFCKLPSFSWLWPPCGPQNRSLVRAVIGMSATPIFLGEVILGRFGAGRGFMLIEVTAPRE